MAHELPSNVNPGIRWIHTCENIIQREAHGGAGWAKNAWTRKMVGKMILTSQLEMAEKSVLDPLDFEPENVMLDGEPPDDLWPTDGGLAT